MTHAHRPMSNDKKFGLVLQGGGALGSYQAGVYEALAAADYRPDWTAGVSIGAINAAIIAGNASANRVERLRSFWEEITAPSAWWPKNIDAQLDVWRKKINALSALSSGHPGFFAPRGTYMNGLEPTRGRASAHPASPAQHARAAG